MIKTKIIFIGLLISQLSHAQSVQDSKIDSLKLVIQKELSILQQKLENEDYLSDYDLKISIDFKCDTFKIERLLSKRMDIDYTTFGMVQALRDAEADYDKLLNKYYQLLLKRLSDTDKEILKQSQRNWIQFRDSERKLNIELSKDEYSGGGTIQQLFMASKYLDITKERVFELYGYLTRFYE